MTQRGDTMEGLIAIGGVLFLIIFVNVVKSAIASNTDALYGWLSAMMLLIINLLEKILK